MMTLQVIVAGTQKHGSQIEQLYFLALWASTKSAKDGRQLLPGPANVPLPRCDGQIETFGAIGANEPGHALQ